MSSVAVCYSVARELADGRNGQGYGNCWRTAREGRKRIVESAGDKASRAILVIDDEPYILRSLSHLLGREGYAVETASNGEEGLARVRAVRPALVFLDIMMPRMNGYEVCEHIKQDPALADTYVIMLSAKGQQIDRELGLLGGADEYMTKPFSPREVAERVHALLRGPSTEGTSDTGG